MEWESPSCLLALLKPFFPRYTGLWVGPGEFSFSFRMGATMTNPASPVRELLGWWLIPVCLVLGALSLAGHNEADPVSLEKVSLEGAIYHDDARATRNDGDVSAVARPVSSGGTSPSTSPADRQDGLAWQGFQTHGLGRERSPANLRWPPGRRRAGSYNREEIHES